MCFLYLTLGFAQRHVSLLLPTKVIPKGSCLRGLRFGGFGGRSLAVGVGWAVFLFAWGLEAEKNMKERMDGWMDEWMNG